ncbi:hypothetical protein [Microvirga arsenatis]|uniref:hypothetical protein n=1 Tax=Microvirga arsenatis TaxID=2692265 RepID=UPI001FEDA814|nr:hypothetical protein [Microvirga arsenatis]
MSIDARQVEVDTRLSGDLRSVAPVIDLVVSCAAVEGIVAAEAAEALISFRAFERIGLVGAVDEFDVCEAVDLSRSTSHDP